jgi:hypothetical protein
VCSGPRESIYIDTKSIVGCESVIKCITTAVASRTRVKIRNATDCDVLLKAE